MVQHLENFVQQYGHLAARAVGAHHYGNVVRHTLARRDTMSASVVDMDQSFQMKIHATLEEMPPWGIAVLVATICLGFLCLASIRYTLHRVVTTLAMVESPQTTVLIREEKYSEKPDALVEDIMDEDVIVIKQKPITSNIRKTMLHLKAQGGFRARWRGLSAMIAYGLTYACLKNVMTDLFAPLKMFNSYVDLEVAPIVASILSHLLVARLGLTWTHIVISEPSAKPWYRRIPDRKSWKKIVAPTFYNACAWQLAFTLPSVMATSMGLGEVVVTEENANCTAMKLLLVAAIAMVTFIGICIPAEVALRRVYASILPEQDKTIVPFDRTFGGVVVPESEGGDGRLSYAQAWATFDRSARLRLLKLYGKIFFIEVTLHVFFGLILALELFAIVGPRLNDFQVSGPDEVRIQ